MKDVKWFLKRIGKKVKAYSRFYGYTSFPTIENRMRAKYLYGWYQNYKGWVFDDIRKTKMSKRNTKNQF